ncbi:MAG TPA: ferrous iron transporter B [Erysipelotrichaceae bacterium]|nr:ferrous iron transporter B [Erysipelotrichaceae bacterium]
MKCFALLGNPNSGKTTLFNCLTGSTARVGNWPGVTVEKRVGVYKKLEEKVSIIDLPGIYSLSPYTSEEVISRNYILDENPDCIINIVDATNLERNLYLTTQAMETDIPIVIALNMMDEVVKSNISIDIGKLEKEFGIPVVPISALKEENLDSLMEVAYKESKKTRKGQTIIEQKDLKHLIGDVEIAFRGIRVPHPLFHAIKLVERDEEEVKNHPGLLNMVHEFEKTFSDETFGLDFEALIASERYRYISSKYDGIVKIGKNTDKIKTKKTPATRSEKIDNVLTNKWLAIPIFLLILFSIFHLTFSEDLFFLGKIFSMPTLEELGMDTEAYGIRWLACIYDGAIFSPGVMLNNVWNEMLVGEMFGWIQELVSNSGMSDWAIGLLNNGIIDGLAAVLSFLPPILVLFLLFAILEDSGYMARVAFILDRIFRRYGLSGRAFMPMIMGFGCSVPAIINTRTLADEKEKTATIRVIPFFSCGAKLPILTAVAGAIVMYFGVGNADFITYSMYLLGMVTAIVAIIIMRHTINRGEVPPFVMELPNYRLPQFKSLMIHLWDKAARFVIKAFTIILASTIVIWLFSHFSWNWSYLPDEQIDQSILANIGMFVQPILTPLGFGSQLTKWGFVFALSAITGLIAKENVIATFGTLSACIATASGALPVEDATGILYVHSMIEATGITIPGLISFIAFNVLTIPCFATIATAKNELPKGKLLTTTLFWIGTSYIVSSIIYTVGSWWWTLFIWLAAFVLLAGAIAIYNKKHPVKTDEIVCS